MTTEKEKAATCLSAILARELPPNVKFTWDDNYVLKFTYKEKLIFTFDYTESNPNDKDARKIIKCVTDVINI